MGKVRKLKTKLFAYYAFKEQIGKEGYNSFQRQDKKKTASTSCSFSSFSCDQSIGEIVLKGFDLIQTACQREENSKTVKPQQ